LLLEYLFHRHSLKIQVSGDIDLLLGMLRAERLSRKNTRERKNEGKQGCQKD